MIYSLLELYDLTKNSLYLDVAIRTLGTTMNNMGGLDRGYYYAKSAEKIINGNYLEEFNKNKDMMDKVYFDNAQTFWLNDVLKTQNTTQSLNNSLIVMLIISFIAGVISFISPCTLPILPGYIAYSLKTEKRNMFMMSIAFFIGLSLIFTILGMTATAIGGFIREYIPLFTEIAGALILLLGIYILFGGSFSGFNIHSKRSTTLIGALFVGMTLGLAWTPCIGPILVSVLILASTAKTVLIGGVLLFMFAIGISIPLLIVTFFITKSSKENILWRMLKGKMLHIKIFNKNIEMHTHTLISGLLFILLGIAILTGMLTILNQYIASGTIQKAMYNIEEFIIKIF